MAALLRSATARVKRNPCGNGRRSCSRTLWQKNGRGKPERARRWGRRTPVHNSVDRGRSCARLILQCSSLTNDAILRQERHQLPYVSRPRASQRMKPILSVIDLESLWIVVTVLLEFIQKESRFGQ